MLFKVSLECCLSSERYLRNCSWNKRSFSKDSMEFGLMKEVEKSGEELVMAENKGGGVLWKGEGV